MKLLFTAILLIFSLCVTAQPKPGENYSKKVAVAKKKVKVSGTVLSAHIDEGNSKAVTWVGNLKNGVLTVYSVFEKKGKIAEVSIAKANVNILNLDVQTLMSEGGMYGFAWLNVFVETKSAKNEVLIITYMDEGAVIELQNNEIHFACCNKTVATEFIRKLKSEQAN